MSSDLHDRIVSRLLEAREGAGFGPRPRTDPEPEPTALAAIALDDDDAREWLLSHQRDDGGFALFAAAVENDSSTPLAALALPAGEQRERALDHVVSHQAKTIPPSAIVTLNPELPGWGWTPDTFGWVEPTARALLALQVLRRSAHAQIDDGVAFLADRECDGGGWNYGNPVVLGVALEPYAQTTAAALIGLQGADPEPFARGLRALEGLWRAEPGGLTLAMALAAFRLADRAGDEVEAALADEFGRTALLDDVVALGWAAVATGSGLDTLRRTT